MRALVEAHLDPATRDFNFDLLDGEKLEPETLASILATPPMMAEWRVVVVRRVEQLAGSKRFRDILLEVAASPPPGLALILSCTPPQGSKAKFYRELARLGRSAGFPAVTAADVPGWLMERARERFGVEMDLDAAQALGAAVGQDLGVLAMEMEKLVDFVGDRKRITRRDVEDAGTRLPVQDRWRWFDMVGEGRFEEALQTLSVLLSQPGETAVGLATGLTTHLLRLGVVKEGGVDALEPLLPPHQKWVARKLPRQAKQWGNAELDAAVEGLLRVDRFAKASAMSGESHLEEWLLALMARRAVA